MEFAIAEGKSGGLGIAQSHNPIMSELLLNPALYRTREGLPSPDSTGRRRLYLRGSDLLFDGFVLSAMALAARGHSNAEARLGSAGRFRPEEPAFRSTLE
jgi:hypothetical protein